MSKELEIIRAGYTYVTTTHQSKLSGTLAYLKNSGWASFKTRTTVDGVAIYGRKEAKQ